MSELGRGPRKPLEYSGMCRWCGSTDLPKGRRSYCSDECKQETVIRFVPGYARTIVGRRDRWTCQICGDKGRDCDHIVPVSEGGGCCGLDNLRILCSACHGKESGKLRKRLNAAKREIEEAAAPQLVFRLDPIADTGTA
ncbi:MAG: HNH endonuclease [bacterium]|nr:HNH endonuclease [bacterium]